MVFKELVRDVKSDFKFNGGLTISRSIDTYFFNAAFRIMLNYRIGKYFFEHKYLKYFYRIYRYRQIQRGCQVSFKSKIGKNLLLPHPLGIVIGDGTIINDNVVIYQNVTLGRSYKANSDIEYPTVGSNVKIFAGAKVFGGVKIGDNAVIGANAVVNIDVPENGIAVGIPAKIIIR